MRARCNIARRTFALAAALTVAAFAQGCSHDTTPKDTKPGDDLKWVAHTDPGNLFTAEFPGAAVNTTRAEHSGYGEYTMFYTGFRTPAIDIEVGTADFSTVLKKHTPKEVLNNLRDSIGNMFGTKNIVVNTLQIDGHDASEYIMDLPDTTFPPNTTGHFRLCIVGTQVYQMIAIGDNKLVRGPVAERFFKSFHFGPKAAGVGTDQKPANKKP